MRQKIDGIFFDLGVSSPQLENSSRGFSFKCDGPLDMRMNQEKGRTAEDPATRSFQAIRILINEELLELESILASVLCMLKKGGRLLVISFHSIEDRLVKHHFRDLSKVDTSLSGKGSPDYRLLTKKPIRATREEIQANRRSRSARLRGLECLV